jgi:xanthine dehydrogenase accessory factor
MSTRASPRAVTSIGAPAQDLAWLKPLREWPQRLVLALQSEAAVVRVVLATVRGSAPREAGASMLVGQSLIEGSIGGGQLEWQALSAARALLGESAAPARLQRVVLGVERAQCCGGVVELWLERYTRAELPLLHEAIQSARRGPVMLLRTITPDGVQRALVSDLGAGADCDQLLQAPRARALPRLQCLGEDQVRFMERLDDPLPPVWLYGAGHVGQALARILVELPLHLTWIDSRAELLPAPWSDSMQVLHRADPVASVAAAPQSAHFLVLTHSHPLDYALCRGILARDDMGWLGLIGSKSKAARFRTRLARDGLHAERIARLVCPIGMSGIVSKWPAAIAVGVAAQLLQQLAVEVSSQQLASLPAASAMECTSERCASCGSL